MAAYVDNLYAAVRRAVDSRRRSCQYQGKCLWITGFCPSLRGWRGAEAKSVRWGDHLLRMSAWRLHHLNDRLSAASGVRVSETKAESLALDLVALAEAGLIQLGARADGEWVAADPDREVGVSFANEPERQIGDR